MPIIILIHLLQVGKSTFTYTVPRLRFFFFIDEIPGVLLHENIVKITCYPHTPVLEKITVALAT